MVFTIELFKSEGSHVLFKVRVGNILAYRISFWQFSCNDLKITSTHFFTSVFFNSIQKQSFSGYLRAACCDRQVVESAVKYLFHDTTEWRE